MKGPTKVEGEVALGCLTFVLILFGVNVILRLDQIIRLLERLADK